MRRVALGSALVLVAIVVAVIVVDSGGPDADRSELLLTRAPRADGSEMSALPRGTLEVDRHRGCVSLSGQAVVWPTGTTLTRDPPVLRFPGGLVAEPGDTVYGGGGRVRRSTLRGSEQVNGDVAAALDCARRDATVVFFWAKERSMRVAPGLLLKSWVGKTEPGETLRLRGTLAIDVDRDCILLSGEPVVLPPDTTMTTEPAALRLSTGRRARSGDVVEGRGWSIRAAELARVTQRIEGDLDVALECAPDKTEVVVFRGPGTRMTVSPRG
jgi:hypothetical protein